MPTWGMWLAPGLSVQRPIWTTPKLLEINLSAEIGMYCEDDGDPYLAGWSTPFDGADWEQPPPANSPSPREA